VKINKQSRINVYIYSVKEFKHILKLTKSRII